MKNGMKISALALFASLGFAAQAYASCTDSGGKMQSNCVCPPTTVNSGKSVKAGDPVSVCGGRAVPLNAQVKRDPATQFAVPKGGAKQNLSLPSRKIEPRSPASLMLEQRRSAR
jgi:hypothetical protein